MSSLLALCILFLIFTRVFTKFSEFRRTSLDVFLGGFLACNSLRSSRSGGGSGEGFCLNTVSVKVSLWLCAGA
jgi:hypothetical protein